MKLECQYPECTYAAEHEKENIAILYLQSHIEGHRQPKTQMKTPQIDRPELKQDISAEEWYTFVEEWRTFKRIYSIPTSKLADELYQCCDRPLARLLIKENPDIVDNGETALLSAMKKMAVLHVAVSVRRAKLLATKQEHGQSFREFYANIRSSASTCEYIIKCPHPCCSTKEPIDYTSMVVKDIIVGGIADIDIKRDVMGERKLDTMSDKEIVQVVEEKEMARNACTNSRSDVAGVSAYRKQSNHNNNNHNNTTQQQQQQQNSNVDGGMSVNKKLSLKGTCPKCNAEFNLYNRYRSGKMNNKAFKTCIKCFKAEKSSEDSRSSENHAIMTDYVDRALHDDNRSRSDTW